MALTKAHNRMIASQVANVDDYGAVGDGTTDDTAAIQACINANLSFEFTKGKVYKVSGGLTISTNGTTVYGNDARLTGNYAQSGTPSVLESMIVVDTDRVTIKDIRLEYTGTFTVSGDYGGYISGIQVQSGSDDFTADNVTAYGFNRCGINVEYDFVSAGTYCNRPRIQNCNLYSNRVAGVSFGNTNQGIVTNCILRLNGISTSNNTGYGFATWNACDPIDTIVSNNQANDNWRKGIDFHGGTNGVVSNNVCSANSVFGIAAEGVKGSWSIVGNNITDMTDNNASNFAIKAIEFGDYTGQGASGSPTHFVIDGNVVDNFTDTDGNGAEVLNGALVGLSFGNVVISNNIIRVGKVTNFFTSENTAASAGNSYDITFDGNNFYAQEITNVPIYIRSANNRQKVYSNNVMRFVTAGLTTGVLLYDVTAQTGKSFVVTGNSFAIPSGSYSTVDDPIVIRRVTNESVSNNVVNEINWREFDGYRFIDTGTAAPTTRTWTAGSIVYDRAPTAGGKVGWICTTAGTSGTWKLFGAIDA
jgi:parallel beta-helix repeat protein